MEEYEFISEECPWNYFPKSEYKAKRFSIKLNGSSIMYVDYFVNEENFYLLSIFVYPEYRNTNLPVLGSRMMQEYLYEKELKNIKNLVYPNMDQSTKIIYEFDKRRYLDKFNMISIDTSTQEIKEFNEKSS